MNIENEQKKWAWMMEYCLKHQLPPAQSWAWDMARRAYAEKYEI